MTAFFFACLQQARPFKIPASDTEQEDRSHTITYLRRCSKRSDWQVPCLRCKPCACSRWHKLGARFSFTAGRSPSRQSHKMPKKRLTTIEQRKKMQHDRRSLYGVAPSVAACCTWLYRRQPTKHLTSTIRYRLQPPPPPVRCCRPTSTLMLATYILPPPEQNIRSFVTACTPSSVTCAPALTREQRAALSTIHLRHIRPASSKDTTTYTTTSARAAGG